MIFSGWLLEQSRNPNWLDAVLVGLIALSSVYGLFRGLIRSVAGAAGLIAAAVFAGRFASLIDPSLDHAHIQHPPVSGGVAFVIAFIAIVIVVEAAANLLRFLERLLLLGWIDVLGGALFGAVRGVLLGMIVLAGVAMLGSASLNRTVKQAQVAVFFWQNMNGAASMLPAGMRESTIRLVHDKAPFVQLPSRP